MAEQVLLPQQGNTVESCILLEWKKQVGESIDVGEVICEVETDKATFEVESTAAGTILARYAEEGDEVPVMSPLCAVGREGETPPPADTSHGEGEGSTTTDTPATPRGTADTSAPAPAAGSADGSAEPAAPEAPPGVARTGAAEAPPAHPASVPETGTQPRSPQTARSQTAPVGVSPRARMRASELGVSLQGVAGSGPAGRIIERDVAAVAEGAVVPSTASAADMNDTSRSGATESPQAAPRPAPRHPAAGQPSPEQPEVEDIPVRGIRKVIADRMLASLQSTAQLTLNTYADARGLLRLRKRFKTTGEGFGLSGVSINDLVNFAAVRTLLQFPQMNAHFLEDRIRRFASVDLGFAVDTDRGLLVPTIRGAESLSLRGLSNAAHTLAERAVSGQASQEDLAPATFTVTNLGGLGVTDFTPVLNPPQVGILGVGTIQLRPVAAGYDENGNALEVAQVPHIGLSLTIDHRAVDGAPGARFLQALAQRLANIELALAE